MRKKKDAKADYELYKSKGICTSCHKNKASDGYGICEACLKQKRQYYQKNIEHFRAIDRARYAKRKADGICVICGKRPAVPGKKCCVKCAEKQREAAKIYYQRRAAREAEANVR